MSVSRRMVNVGLLAALAGCSTRRTVGADAATEAGDGTGRGAVVNGVTSLRFPLDQRPALDLLVVIDNSNDMRRVQGNLTLYFHELLDQLRHPGFGADLSANERCSAAATSGCALPNLHIGVISTDLGAGAAPQGVPGCAPAPGHAGRLQSQPRGVAGCQGPSPHSYLDYRSVAGSSWINVEGATGRDPVEVLSEAFTCIAQLDGGCGFEQPLEAMRRALDPKANTNPGFLRTDALLAVLVVTDEDDCSVRDPALFDPARLDLGPLSSFRCFEHGVSCDIGGREPGERHGCRSRDDPSALLWPLSRRYEDFLRTLKPPGRLQFAAIAAPPGPVEVVRDGDKPFVAPTCSASEALALPAIRLHGLATALGGDGVFFGAVCEPMGSTLEALGVRLRDRLLEPAHCLGAPLLAGEALVCSAGDRYGPGASCAGSCLTRAECEVTFHSTGKRGPWQKPIPRCAPAKWEAGSPASCASGPSCPCWRLVRHQGCATGGGPPHAVQILEGEATLNTPYADQIEVRCRATAEPWGSAALAERTSCP